MKAILVTCPHCGARLQVGDTLDAVTCDYCGTAARVQRRTTVLERVLPPPATGPAPIAVQQHNVRWLGFLIVLGAVGPLVGAGAVAFKLMEGARAARILRTSTSPVAVGTPPPPEAPEWQGTTGALFTDVDGDGTPDVIGRSRRVRAGDVVRVIALDGATGKPLWETEPLGTYSDTFQGTLALAGDQVVFASPRGQVQAFQLRTGATRWTTTLDERVERFCDGGAETIVALGTDDVARPLDRATGVLRTSPAAQPPPARRAKPASRCAVLPSDQDTQRFRGYDPRASRIAGKLGVSQAFLAAGPGGRVLAGTRSKGTGVPTLIALDDRDGERWRVLIPRDPLGSAERAPEHVLVSDREACVSYYETSVARPARVACFALADGTRLWDEVSEGSFQGALQLIGHSLAISSVGRLQLRDLATGKPVWTLGR